MSGLKFFFAVAILALAPHLEAKNSVSTTASVTVKGMVCSFCAQGVTKKFKAEPAVKNVDVSLETKLVTITFNPDQTIDDEKITQLLTDSGYNVVKIERGQE